MCLSVTVSWLLSLGYYFLVTVSWLLLLGYCSSVIVSWLLFLGYYSAHPRKRRVVLSQLPHVLWASGCWHYERTLYSRRPLKGTGVSIYLLSTYIRLWMIYTKTMMWDYLNWTISHCIACDHEKHECASKERGRCYLWILKTPMSITPTNDQLNSIYCCEI
jgi:hypothetical protein